MKKYTITRIAPRRYIGVREAAKGLSVRPQSIYMYLGGWPQSLGPKKRERIEVVDLTVRGSRWARNKTR